MMDTPEHLTTSQPLASFDATESSVVRNGGRTRVGAAPFGAAPMPARAPRPVTGFTLVEILIVVVILGLIAAMIIISLGDSQRETRQTAFVSDLKSFAQAATLFQAKTGDFLEDSASGELPAGFEDFIDENAWVRITPIGGVWDSEFESFGIISALGVHFDGSGSTRDDPFMAEIDEMLDDGDLATGVFRKIADARYYYVIKD